MLSLFHCFFDLCNGHLKATEALLYSGICSVACEQCMLPKSVSRFHFGQTVPVCTLSQSVRMQEHDHNSEVDIPQRFLVKEKQNMHSLARPTQAKLSLMRCLV